jgi:23S rRNA pseudouridine1911/1915/1917 synthase
VERNYALKAFTLQWLVEEKDEGKLVRDFLREHEISRTALTDIKFKGGSILVNGQPVNVRYILKKGDQIQVQFPPEQPSKDMKPENIPFEIEYEDDFLLVINKPPHMSTIPSREHPTGSLANAILYYYQTRSIQSTIHMINRLDRDTSGLLLVAKHRHVHHLFTKLQQQGKVKRRYEAIVHGVMKSPQGTINLPIGRKGESIIEREVRPDGQRAVTHYTVLRCFGHFTHVSLQLETGRTHQIRVHLSHIGHPLAGDDLYGGERDWIQRQALHSKQITFWHPFLQQEMSFTTKLPHDMEFMLKEIGDHNL